MNIDLNINVMVAPRAWCLVSHMIYDQWRIQGANPAMTPIEVGNRVCPPSGAERVMIAFGICRNVRIFAPPCIDVGYRFGPPYRKIPH